MRVIVTVILALLLLCLESVIVRKLGLSITRMDVTVALVVFLGLRANLLEGAFSASLIGYLLDVMSGRPTGLYPFLAVVVLLGVRLVTALVEVRSAPLYVLFTAGASLGHGLMAAVFTWVTSKSGGLGAGLTGLPLQMLLSALTAVCLWPVLRRLDPGRERHDVGVLR